MLPSRFALRLLLASSLAAVLPAAPLHAQLTPPRPDLTDFVVDEQWAAILGKALFWEAETGSDGMACAGCHFSAGADSRISNQLNPGTNHLPLADEVFGAVADYDGEPIPGAPVGRTASGAVAPDGRYELVPEDFPFHQLSDITDRNSPIVITTNDIASSSGSPDRSFRRLIGGPDGPEDLCTRADAEVFHARRRAARMVEPRATPTTINAVFNFVQFWDGRAKNSYNGFSAFGARDNANDPRSGVLVLRDGSLGLEQVQIPDASLASQAMLPPLSNMEMSCEGRTFADLGRKLLGHRPLAGQRVHPQDSLFGEGGPHGDLIHVSGRGLERGYDWLIRQAFDPKLWQAPGRYVVTADGSLDETRLGFSQAELNFGFFWGLSILVYESTLVSDQSPFDSCNPATVAGVTSCQDEATLNEQELRGFALFNNFGRTACFTCHPAPLFSEAQHQAGEGFLPIERSRIDVPVVAGAATHDRGFFNIGLRPASFDPGVGGVDPYGDPLSFTRTFLAEQDGAAVSDPTGVVCDTSTDVSGGGQLIEPGGTPTYGDTFGYNPDGSCAIIGAAEREMVDGAFKTPGLRNIGITAPYFHYDGYADLHSVMEFYNRGGSHRAKSQIDPSYTGDTSGSGPLGKGPIPVAGRDFGTSVDRFVRPLGLTPEEIDDVVAFMLSLTDERVACDAAPFDHPELPVPNGHRDRNGSGIAEDIVAVIPASGAGGYAADGRPELCLPNTGDLFDPALRNRLITP